MKILLAIFISITFMLPLSAQTIEAEKTYSLSKDAKKGYLGSFKYDEATREYTLIFIHQKNSKTIYVTYKYDYDFNLINENSETLNDDDATVKYDFVNYNKDTWPNPTVVRIAQGLDLTLRQGKIYRHWERAYVEYFGKMTLLIPAHYEYEFNETQKVKPRLKVDELSDMPKFIQKSASRIQLINYATDEPSMEIAKNYGLKASHWGENKKTYAEASGDLLVFGAQSWMLKNFTTAQYLAIKYDAKTLKEKHQSIIKFDKYYGVVFSKALSDGSIAAVLAPMATGKNKPINVRDYYYLRINKDADVQEKIAFKSPSSKWEINDFAETETGDVIVYGAAFKKKNDKAFNKLQNPKFDNFQIMRISKGKIEYVTSTSFDEFKSKQRMPKGMKKINSYEGKNFVVGNLVSAANGDIFISGQAKNEDKYENIGLFHFDNQGKLKAQYGYKIINKGTKINPHVEFNNTDKKTLSWLIYESDGQTETKNLLYPRIATIDIESATVSEFKQMYNKKNKFYIDNDKPIIFIENRNKAIFFGADKKDENIWFSRVKLGK